MALSLCLLKRTLPTTTLFITFGRFVGCDPTGERAPAFWFCSSVLFPQKLFSLLERSIADWLEINRGTRPRVEATPKTQLASKCSIITRVLEERAFLVWDDKVKFLFTHFPMKNDAACRSFISRQARDAFPQRLTNDSFLSSLLYYSRFYFIILLAGACSYDAYSVERYDGVSSAF